MTFTNKRGVVIHDRVLSGKLKIQKHVGGNWVTTAFAEDIEAARRHAEAVGGSVQVLDRKARVVASFGAPVT
jgi:predicted enzyme related to lactoylglutathione lyase